MKNPSSSPYKDSIQELISLASEDTHVQEHTQYVEQMIETCLKLVKGDFGIDQLKLINRALKELRYAYNIFNKSKGARRISIFGSARTEPTHPDYLAAENLAALMASQGWMAISGGAHGIMQASISGATAALSFGLSIHLPYEKTVTPLIEGDPKLIRFRYFFTRKLIFATHSDAFAAFPGGFGTQDEIFEVLTLMQTGKAQIVPVVFLEGEEGVYWKYWEQYVHKSLLLTGMISEEDLNFFYLAPTPEEAMAHINHFYHRYHSSRYVRDTLVIRLKSSLTDQDMKQLNQEFSSLVYEGEITQTCALEEEDDYLNLPRVSFHHTRKNFGLVRKLIDRINSF